MPSMQSAKNDSMSCLVCMSKWGAFFIKPFRDSKTFNWMVWLMIEKVF